ncbi:amino acid adenylation domain-containing protein [Leeia sp.]|uniref:amino acid adenylation domain-containing protein n=1 Tax=Leeia sp. TaxID=2884678 RepID=UPI0035B3E5E5
MRLLPALPRAETSATTSRVQQWTSPAPTELQAQLQRYCAASGQWAPQLLQYAGLIWMARCTHFEQQHVHWQHPDGMRVVHLQLSPQHSLQYLLHQGLPENAASDTAAYWQLSTLDAPLPEGLALGLRFSLEPLALELTCDASVLDVPFLRTAPDQIWTLFSAALTQPDTPVGQLKMLTPAQRTTQLVQWNQTALPYPQNSHLAEQFHQVAMRQPDAIAVSQQGAQLSYGELDRQSSQLANQLLQHGIQPGMRIGVCLQRSLALPLSLLAILKAGACYVPLDPDYPAQRLDWMLAFAECAWVLLDHTTAERMPAPACPVLQVESLLAHSAAQPLHVPDGQTQAEDPAYCIYTSGSTGVPKGVMVTHRGVLRLAMGSGWPFPPDAVCLQSSSMAFDASTWEIWGALLNGARLEWMPPGQITAESVADVIAREQVSHLGCSTGLFHQLVEQHLPKLGSLKRLIAGGEAMSRAHAQRFLEALPGTQLVNGYGPAENTTASTAYQLTLPLPAGSMPIGKAIGNSECLVLDEQLQLLPPGVTGELYVGGDGLALGYLKQPELTAARFIDHPFRPGARLYRTGDLVRQRADGVLLFVGRQDHQVKVRGYRVELPEVEAALSSLPAIRQVAVVVRQDSATPELVAYLVTDTPAPTRDRIRAALAARLPAFMLPTAYVLLPNLPRTPNGKVDHAALPAPGRSRPVLTTPYVAPETVLEKQLAAIWEAVLDIAPIGMNDDFYALGGHSLRATQITARIRNELGFELSVADTLAWPSVRQLLERLQHNRPVLEDIRPCAREGDHPLSLSQERVLFLETLNTDLLAYNAQAAFHLQGPLQVDALAQALSDLVERHDILRTTFHSGRGEPVQRVAPAWQVPLPLLDLSMLAADEQQVRLKQEIEQRVRQRFQLDQLPLAYWYLFKQAEERHVLLHVEHHFVHDGWSFGIFLNELRACYLARSTGKAPQLPPVSAQYIDYVHWQRNWLNTPHAQAQLDYWVQLLRGAPPLLELPTDRPAPPVQRFQGTAQRVELPARLANAMRQLCQQEGVTLFVGLYAAYVVLLHRLTGSDDLCVGTAVANRQLKASEGMMGMLVNTIALRNQLGPDQSFTGLLQQVREQTLQGFAHQELPFDRVVEALSPVRSLSHAPVCQTLFSFHDAPMPDRQWGSLEVDIEEAINNGSAKFALDVVAIPRVEQQRGSTQEAITLIWEYQTALFDDATIRRMIDSYFCLLEAVVVNRQCAIGQLPLQDAALQAATMQLGRPQPVAVQDVHLAAALARHARNTPQACAVQHGAHTLSYAELEAKSNQLARLLKTYPLAPDSRIALCLPRSPWQLIALLGILKAGAAYVPIDPDWPADRQQAVLHDSAAVLLLGVDALPQCTVRQLPLAAWQAALPGQDSHPLALEQAGLAYCLYTSGSTGAPKGVMVGHQQVLHQLAALQAHYTLSTADRVLQSAALTFDVSVGEIFMAWSAGACLVLREEAWMDSLPRWVSAASQAGITVADLPTAFWSTLAQEASLTLPPSLRLILIGGEAVSPVALQAWFARPQPLPRLLNAYGPTETTINATLCEPRPDGSNWHAIGRPLANSPLHVLDLSGQPVQVGVAGELYISGPCVAQGYLNQPELTASRFLPDPYLPGQRMYRTGDRVRWRVDGELDFLGRLDQQLKLRGFRIEPGEVEAALQRCPGVRACVVFIREQQGEPMLVACLEGHAEVSLLKQQLQQTLPAYMVPSAFLVVPQLPLTAQGKVDRRALLQLPWLEPDRVEAMPPRSEMEIRLQPLWQHALGRPVGLQDNFFTAGGHSLLAMKLIAQIEAELGLSLNLRTLFEHPTLAELALWLEQQQVSEEDEAAAILAELAHLSDEEIAALLDKVN